MLKSLIPVVMALTVLPCVAQTAASRPEPASAEPCTISKATGGDIRVVTCALAAGRSYRLTARFSGGHDDTSASLTARLDGRPVDCEAGSKVSLFGEDGDVELYCRVSAARDTDATRTLVTTVLWSHAQYRDVILSAE